MSDREMETPREEVPQTEEAAPAVEEEHEEAPPQVIQIRAPPPFDEASLEPFIDIFMEKRGLSDRKQAAVRLANVLWHIGYDPRKDIENVTTYINNLSTVLNALPNTPETMPVKGALLARGATDTLGLLGTAHFGEQESMDKEMRNIVRYATRARVTMRMLDNVFTGGENMAENPKLKSLEEKVNRLTEEKVLDAKLTPLREQMKSIQQTLQNLITKKPGADEESAAMKDVKNMLGAMDKRLDAIDQRYQFSTEVQGIRNEITDLKASIDAKGGKAPGDVSDVFDQATKLMDKIKEVTGKYGAGGEGEFDWRVAGITSVSEVATEAIKTYRDIATKEGAEEAEKSTAQTEKISEKIIDRKLLSFIQQKASKGALEFISTEAAKAIGVSEDDVLNSYKRLKEKGILRNVGETSGEGTKTRSAEPEQEWVEG